MFPEELLTTPLSSSCDLVFDLFLVAVSGTNRITELPRYWALLTPNLDLTQTGIFDHWLRSQTWLQILAMSLPSWIYV